MDFVVVGLGVGALAVLLGLTIRDAGARWWSVPANQDLPDAEVERRLSLGRAGRAGGLVLGVAGGAIILVTLAALILGLSDRMGAIVVMAVISLAVLGGMAWGVIYAQRHHPRPVSRAARRRQLAAGPVPDAVPSLAETIDAETLGVADPAGEDELAAAPTGEEDELAAARPVVAGPRLAELAGPDDGDRDPLPGPILGPPLPVSEPGILAAAPHDPAGDATAPDDGEAVPSVDTSPADGAADTAIAPTAAGAAPAPDPTYAASGQERRR